jgi:hypothetical protein
MQEALVDAMKFDLEEGNFCDVLLDKITDEDDKKKNNNNSSSPFAHKPMNSDLDMLKLLLRNLSCRLSNESYGVSNMICAACII